MASSPRRTTGFIRHISSDIPALSFTLRGRRVMNRSGRKGTGASKQLQSDLLLKLELRSNPEALGLVRATLERATETLHFQDAERRAIVRSVDEALANVIRHAYGGKGGLPIAITLRRLRKSRHDAQNLGIEVLLEDTGVAVTSAKLQGRPLDKICPGGLGLHFMKQGMDQVEFCRKKGKNQLRMVKYLASAKPDKRPEGV
jgi:anti-sigma regulatory factor (Ser/Thr protein kinase)